RTAAAAHMRVQVCAAAWTGALPHAAERVGAVASELVHTRIGPFRVSLVPKRHALRPAPAVTTVARGEHAQLQVLQAHGTWPAAMLHSNVLSIPGCIGDEASEHEHGALYCCPPVDAAVIQGEQTQGIEHTACAYLLAPLGTERCGIFQIPEIHILWIECAWCLVWYARPADDRLKVQFRARRKHNLVKFLARNRLGLHPHIHKPPARLAIARGLLAHPALYPLRWKHHAARQILLAKLRRRREQESESVKVRGYRLCRFSRHVSRAESSHQRDCGNALLPRV